MVEVDSHKTQLDTDFQHVKKYAILADASGALLLRAGAIDSQGLTAALAHKEREGGTLGEALISLGLLAEERLVSVFQQTLLVPRASASTLMRAPKEVVTIIPAEMAMAHGVLPVELDAEGNLTLAMVDPSDNRAVDEVAAHTGRFVMRAVATPAALREAIRVHHAHAAAKDDLPPTARVVPEASAPPPRVPGPALQALVRAVSGGTGPTQPAPAPVAPAAAVPVVQERPTESGRTGKRGRTTQTPRRQSGPQDVVGDRPKSTKSPRKPPGSSPARPAGQTASDPILLDRPVRTPQPPGTTLPGVGGKVPGPTGTTGVDESLLAPVARLRAASNRDEVIAVLLDYASKLAARVGLFVVQKGQLVCLDGRGPDHVVVAMKWFTIPVDTPSPFRDVLDSKVPYHGRLDDTAESRAFRNALGSSPGNLLLLPLMVGDRAVGVLYADQIHTDLGQLSTELLTLSREAGAAFVRIILSSKRRPA
jgi:hypothetical protein